MKAGDSTQRTGQVTAPCTAKSGINFSVQEPSTSSKNGVSVRTTIGDPASAVADPDVTKTVNVDINVDPNASASLTTHSFVINADFD